MAPSAQQSGIGEVRESSASREYALVDGAERRGRSLLPCSRAGAGQRLGLAAMAALAALAVATVAVASRGNAHRLRRGGGQGGLGGNLLYSDAPATRAASDTSANHGRRAQQNASSCAKEHEAPDDIPCCTGLHVGRGKPGLEEGGLWCHSGTGFRGPVYKWEACKDLVETYYGQTCAEWGRSSCDSSVGLNFVCPVTCGICKQGEMYKSGLDAWRVLYPNK